MSETAVDLDAYFRRIGYGGPTDVTLQTLGAIQARHACSIPFENIDPLLGRPVRLDIASLQRKLVDAGRGGYCFEHGTLLLQVLRALGFDVGALAARVLWRQPKDVITPRTHMLLRVELAEGAFLVDVGFGRATPTTPLALVADVEQPTGLEPFRLLTARGELELQIREGAEWATLYRFSLEIQHAVDRELANWFVATHPASIFVNHLLAARPTAVCRHGLFGHDYTLRLPDGSAEQRRLADAAAVVEVLEREFLVVLTPADRQAVMQRLDAPAASARG